MSAVGVSILHRQLVSLWQISLWPAGIRMKSFCASKAEFKIWLCSTAAESAVLLQCLSGAGILPTNNPWIDKVPCACVTDPLQHPVTSAQHYPPGPQTAAASRRRPSSQDGTGSPQSSDNEHSSGRLQTDTGRGYQSDRVKAIKMEECCPPPHAGFEAITHNGHIITLSFFFF